MSGWPYTTTTWRRLRAAKLGASPLCEVCTLRGRVTPAKAVDHVQPINQGGEPFPPLSGLMAMCERCHNEKTAGHDRQGGNTTGRRFKGFDAKGNPIDPGDGWHEERTERHVESYAGVRQGDCGKDGEGRSAGSTSLLRHGGASDHGKSGEAKPTASSRTDIISDSGGIV